MGYLFSSIIASAVIFFGMIRFFTEKSLGLSLAFFAIAIYGALLFASNLDKYIDEKIEKFKKQ